MRILYDHRIFQEQVYGGISRYFSELIPRVAARQSVMVYQGVHLNRYPLDAHRSSFEFFWGRRVDRYKGSRHLISSVNTLGLNALASIRRPDVYHQTYYGVGLVGRRCARILTVYDMIHEIHPEFFNRTDYIRLLKRMDVARADHVIAISNRTKHDLVQILGTPPEKITTVYLGHTELPQPSETRPVDAPYVLFVGDRGRYKNFARFLQSWSLAGSVRKHFRLLCFGGGPFNAEENEQLRALKLTEQVRWQSGSDELLATAYRHATAFVFPSLYEGFGLPLLEAMQLGCPVICSSSGSLPEIAGNAAAYFDATDADDIAAVLDRVLSDELERQRLAQLGRLRAKEFNWDRCADETIRVYRGASGN